MFEKLKSKVRAKVGLPKVEGIPDETWARIEEMEAGQNEYGFDPFGFEPGFLKYVGPPIYFFHKKYFRSNIVGLENVPDTGACILVSNHSGQIALDGMLIGAACIFDKTPPRMIRSMVEHWIPTLPFVSWVFARAGQVTGTRDNARLLLERDGCLLVFPEGVKGISKTYDRAYELSNFGLGFMRLALETKTPIIPIGVVGGEEQIPSIWNIESIAKTFGLPSFPITPLGAMPLPVKYHIRFGEPLLFEGKADEEDRAIRDKVSVVTKSIEKLIDQGLAERKGFFF